MPGEAGRLWVVIPAHNEEGWIEATLDALRRQSDTGFDLVVVDNASTDATARVAEQWLASHPGIDGTVITDL